MFSPIQKRVIASALTTFASLLLAACLLVLFLILHQAINLFSSVIWPLAVAFILSMLLHPVVNVFEKNLKLSRSSSTVILYALVLIASIIALALAAPMLISQIMDLLHFIPDFLRNIYESFKQQYPRIIEYAHAHISAEDIDHYSDTALESLQGVLLSSLPALQQAGGNIVRFFSWATGAAIIPIYLFYFLETKKKTTDDLEQQLTFLSPKIKEDLIFLIDQFIQIVVSFFRGQLLIGIIMGILLAAGFTAIGLKFALIFGIAIGLLNVIPYLGTIVGLGIVLPIAFYQPNGSITMAGLVLAVFFVVQIIEGYLLTPRIMGKQTGLHPMAIIIAIFFWGIALDGLLGMILAIPLTAFFIIAWRLLKKKYLPLLTGHGN